MKKYDEATTSRLENILKSVKTDDDIQEYMEKHTKNSFSTFSDYFNSYLIRNKLDYPSVMNKSNISKNYFYNIINGDRNPGRDKIIALCIGAGMSCHETNRALKIAKEGILYPKDPRDARIMICINNGINTVTELNIILDDNNLQLIK